MNHLTYFEDRASRSRGTYAGESSPGLCDRLSRTRDFSQRQLPTDHDYAVPTREYQTDQSSFNSAPAVAGPVLDRPKPQRQKTPTDVQGLTRSLHISPWGHCPGLASTFSSPYWKGSGLHRKIVLRKTSAKSRVKSPNDLTL